MSSGRARVQQPAPPFDCTAVVDGGFEDIGLANFTSTKKWLVLCFIPMAWTFVCPTEIIAFDAARAEFGARGAAVCFASTDSEYSLLAWNMAARADNGLGGISVPLLSDKNHRLSRDYGVLIEEEGVALRGMFLIDPNGVVRQITINDLSVGRSVDEALRLIDAFQYVDKYGEACPAGWRKGQDGIRTDSIPRKPSISKGPAVVGAGAGAGVDQPMVGAPGASNGSAGGPRLFRGQQQVTSKGRRLNGQPL